MADLLAVFAEGRSKSWSFSGRWDVNVFAEEARFRDYSFAKSPSNKGGPGYHRL